MNINELEEMGLNAERLLRVKDQFRIPSDDPIWTYIAALEYYQRIYEAQPKYLIESANAERERMQAETNKIIASTHEQISRIASEITASAAKKLVENVGQAIVNRSEKALMRERIAGFISAFILSASAAAFAGFVGGTNFTYIQKAYYAAQDNFFYRILLMIWNVPAGWVVVITIIAIAVSYFTELSQLTARKKLYDMQP